ncbi:hypothetical protein I2483_13090 [Sporosarcina sp. E16_3]|uniref:hypothetical protein n=1 Tax=unclassified Sporosarcina TaxID=2647733 RepID=UPI001648E7CD|nr:MULTISPECIES: hypothetical protein [unclassified Sporosarcina]MBO0602596.1 hypothetical protein [Sporosarcina sp. E16_3]
MKVWKGLLQKEWAQMKWRLAIFVLINSLFLSWGVDRVVFGLSEGFLTSIQPMIGLFFLLHVIMAVSLLFRSLGKDIRRPDIWLHSPASMQQLIGAKFLLILLATGFSLLLCGMVVGISYYVGEGAISIADNLSLWLRVGVVILLNALYVMALVFFFWSIYQVFRSWMGWFSIVVVIISVNIWLYGWALVWFTQVFQTVKEMMPMYGPIQPMELLMLNNYIVPGGTILTIGSLVLYGMMTALYFVVGSMLFEKKVRL